LCLFRGDCEMSSKTRVRPAFAVVAQASLCPLGSVLPMDTGSAGPERSTRLLGRARECALLDGLIGDIRRGQSRCLVVRGEAGIGKTALLQYLMESASDLTVLRAVGVESEMELPFASLHQLCASHLNRLPRLA
jgi:hypothetical protein